MRENRYICSMIEQIKSPRFIVLSLLVLCAASTRALPLLIPHTWNFTAIGALAIFAGSQFGDKRFAFAIPLIAMALSDLFIGHGFSLTVYIGLTSMVACGVSIRKNTNLTTVAMASVVGTLLFFLITNFAYIYSPSLYPHNIAGVVTSYVMGLPFLRNMLIGDAFYGFALFGGFYLIRMRYPALAVN